MSRASVFRLPVGQHIDAAGVRGYYVDLREKAESPSWPPPWFPYPGYHRYIALGQWALGAHERWLHEGDGRWRDAVLAAARLLVTAQERADARLGLWLEPEPYPHTFRMRGPWPSAMAQGLCASVLVRAHLCSPDATFAQAARDALAPLRVPTAAGGVQALLDGRPFPEEYPTTPSSFVLNGALYAIFGVFDVWRGLEDDAAGRDFADAVAMLEENLWRWDLGYWSRYDLYHHGGPVRVNVASASYHALHVSQLRALSLISGNRELDEIAGLWEAYAASRLRHLVAFAAKGLFRLAVPRNHALAGRLPWADAPHRSQVAPAHDLEEGRVDAERATP